jgi:hypothetical protein
MMGPVGWMSHPDAFFAAFDSLVADARAQGLHLVPSFLWETFLFPDLAGEPRGRLFVPGSDSRKLAERFISEFVTRYKDNDAILFWELGNEMNLQADLDVSCDACSSSPACAGAAEICVGCGTPCKRTAADNILSCNDCRGISSEQQDLGAFSGAIATLIHGIDSKRMVSSGDTLPRFAAYHLARQAGNYVSDTPDQFDSTILQLHPDGVDLISIHPYPEGVDVSPSRFGDSDLAGAALVARLHALALQHGKKLYIGEYGEVLGGSVTCGGDLVTCGGDATKWYSRRMLDAIVREGVEFSGMWAYEAYEDIRCPMVPNCYTVTNADPFIDYMETRQKAFGTCAGAADGAGCPGGTCTSAVCQPPLTPPPVAPASLAHLAFATANDVKDWIVFTNCTACTPGTFTVDAGKHLARLVSHDLPCTGDCAYPGVYAATPRFPVTAGHVTLRFSARSTTANGIVRFTAWDAQKQQVGGYDVAVAVAAEPVTNGITFSLPATATAVDATAVLFAPDSTMELSSIEIDGQP